MTPGGIAVHCSDSPQGRGDDASTLRRWHLQRGWSNLGYHAVILEDGTIQQEEDGSFPEGREESRPGAHVKGFNDWLGVCMIGIDEFTPEQFDALEQYIRDNREQYGDLPVQGHYQFPTAGGKTCPNFDVVAWLEERGL